MTHFKYPDIRKMECSEEYHGTKIEDEYRWLEDPDSDETKRFVEAQNTVTTPFLESFKHRDTLSKRVTEMWDYAKYSCPARKGDHYYYRHNTGLQNQSVVYVQDSPSAEPRVFFDPNTLSEDGTIALGSQAFSEDGSLVAYTLSNSGSDWKTVKFRKAPSGEDLPDVLEKVKFSCLSWTHDNKGIFYNSYTQDGTTDGTEVTSNIHQKLYYHLLGTPQSDDVLVAEFPDNPHWNHGVELSDCGEYILQYIHDGCAPVNKLYYAKLSDVDNKITKLLPMVKIIDNFDAKYDYVTNEGSVFTFMTNLDSPNYRLINIDFESPEQENWTSLVPEDPKAVLEWAACVNNNVLVLCYLEDVKSQLYLYDLKTGTKKCCLPLDVGTVVGFSCKKQHSEMFYQFMSFLSPGVIFRYDFTQENPKPEVYKEIAVSGYKSSDFESSQVFYKSKDGTTIPMFIVHKKGLVKDGSNPVLLYGYGGFTISITPTFSVSRVMFMQHLGGVLAVANIRGGGVSQVMFMQHLGGVLAVANIRGGGEYGETWHKGGYLGNKQNVFDDFQYAAQYLVHEKYTSSERIAIHGGSNGGLLVGACANQRPDLFGCVIASVGVMDMLRFHKFTIGHAWTSDFGSSDEPEQFQWLIKINSLLESHVSPKMLDQLQKHRAVHRVTFRDVKRNRDHDDRVCPLHSFKFISRLQHKLGGYSEQKRPLMIRIDTKSGHGMGKPTTKVIEEVVDIYSFIALNMDLQWSD